ncbi:MAG: hypothetical protein J6S85_14275 [Methanobrevibacter sp.]|nr:hypothetical protein [Methanobrevibacter sp.]
MTSLGAIVETALYGVYGDKGANEDNERKSKILSFARERLIDYYKHKLWYYNTEIKHWKENERGEIPNEVMNVVLADIEYELKRNNI